MVLSAAALITVLAFSFLARADVIPSEPSPGAIYNEGQQCAISWKGDPDKSDAWKSMNIALMTGDNFNMIQLMVVGTTFDGSIDGHYSFTCPEVTINSAIYFYQFTSSQTSDKAWTTRYTIAGPNGETTPPANAVQPNSGEEIPWGVGGLVGSSQSVPPPTGAASPSLPPSIEGPATSSSQSSVQPAVATTFTTVTPSPTLPTTRLVVVSSSASQSSPSTAPNTATQTDGTIRTSTASVMIALVLPVFALVLI